MTGGADKTPTDLMVYGILQFFVSSFGLDFILTEAVFWISVTKSRNNIANNYRGTHRLSTKLAVTMTVSFPSPIFPLLILVFFLVVNTICSLYIHGSVERAK